MKKSTTDLRTLTVGAMLTAISIVVGILCKNYLNFGNGLFRITFENFPIILAGILYGPAVGGCVGACADILSYVLSTQSLAISPIVTLGAITVGVVAGLTSHYIFPKDGIKKTVFSTLIAHVCGSMIIKSFGLYAYYGAAVLVRVPLYLVIATLETLLLVLLFRNRNFLRAIGKRSKDQ